MVGVKSHCSGSAQPPISFALVCVGVNPNPEVFGECQGCGHYYSLRNDRKVHVHGWDGCFPNIFGPSCRSGGSAIRSGHTLVQDLAGIKMMQGNCTKDCMRSYDSRSPR